MAYNIIDRTLNGKRSSGNRSKFVRRVKKTVRDQVKKQITEGNVDDLVSGKGKKVTVPKKDLSQPTFNHGMGGKRKIVHPGNKKYSQGDRIDRPKGGAGGCGGKGASKDGEGQDDFEFNLTFEEFLDMFFEDCELPNLEDTVITMTDKFAYKRAGFSTDGPANQMNIVRTMRTSKGRRIGLNRKSKKNKLIELELEEARLAIEIAELEAEEEKDEKKLLDLNRELLEVRKQVMGLRRKLRAVPFVDETDCRYNRWERVPVPTSQAVMFCLMDVSGSMGQWEKEMAKRYFMILYMFLTRNYKRVDVVWIRHHSVAKIVDEEEFFKSRETGGTIVSSALEKMVECITGSGAQYSPEEWNIYGSQVSDGDNWGEDSRVAQEMLIKDILPFSRYYTYIEVNKNASYQSDLWPIYETIAKQFRNFQMKVVSDASEIFPVFKQLFSKSKRVKSHDKAA